MPEQNKRIEDAFNKFLAGEELKNALSLAGFLSASEMVYDGEYEMYYKDELACYINTPSEQDKPMGNLDCGRLQYRIRGFSDR